MKLFDSIVLYVDDISVSRSFYEDLLGQKGESPSPTFHSYELASGLKLELKVGAVSLPPAELRGGGTELCIAAAGEEEYENLLRGFRARGTRFLQEPTTLVFGPTFVVLDPDGHRIRVFLAS